MLSESTILAGAKAMHQRYEQRQERRHPFYTRQRWDQIREQDRQEFIDWATCVLKGAGTT